MFKRWIWAIITQESKNKGKGTYKQRRKERGAKVAGGAILNMRVYLSHPLFYGYNDEYLASFKKGNHYFKPLNDIYNTCLLYTSPSPRDA